MEAVSSIIIPILLGSFSLLPILDPVVAAQSQSSTVDRPPLEISSDFSEKAALDILLSPKRYDLRLLPPSLNELSVNVSVLLLSLASPDESSLKYEVEFLIYFVWIDARLKFEIINATGPSPTYAPDIHEALPIRHQPRRRPYLDVLHHKNRIWVPDVYFVKHGDFRANLDPVNIALRLFPNGTVTFTTRRHLILSCRGDLGIFPFDDPECSFSIESSKFLIELSGELSCQDSLVMLMEANKKITLLKIHGHDETKDFFIMTVSHEKDALEFRWQTDAGVLRKSPQLALLNAYMDKNETSYCDSSHWRGNYSCLNVKLIFNRDRAFYFTTVFIPDIILVTSSFITFWLEWNAVPARVMLGVTTMLNFFTTSNGFRSTLPVVSNLTAMNIWDGFSMSFIYASLLEFVFVNYIGRKRPRRASPTTVPTPHSSAQSNKIEGNQTSPVGSLAPAGPHPTEVTVTCTQCGPSPCTHLVNENCPRRRIIENPIRVAKTIDVVSRIVFPIAYFIFLIFFFVEHRAFF